MTEEKQLDIEVDNYNEQSIAALARTIQLFQDNFALILARCNYSDLKEQIMEKLRDIIPFEISEVTIEKSTTSLYNSIQDQINNSHHNVLVIFGLESAENIDQIITSSNYVREEFRNSFAFPIILWVTDDILIKLIQIAPDFESWTTTFKFEFSINELILLIEKHTEHLFRRVLEVGAHKLVPKSIIFESCDHLELESARKDISHRNIKISPTLEARLDFILGLEAYINNQREREPIYLQKSLDFWQKERKLKQQGCLLYYLGLWWRRNAFLHRYENNKYEHACKKAEGYFQQCVDLFNQDHRPDLAAKFINALGEVLQRRRKWSELKVLANKAIELHLKYHDQVRLSYAYGLLAEATLEEEKDAANWVFAKQTAEKAIETLNDAELSLSGDPLISKITYLRECNYNRGWYLLLLASSLKHLEQFDEAIKHLKSAQEIGHELGHHLYIKILEKLRSLYIDKGSYKQAFHIKRKKYSIEQQYGLRAFVGAGFLQPKKYLDWAVTDNFSPTSIKNGIAPEIQASNRNQDVENIIQKISSHHCKFLVIYGPSGVGKSSLIKAGLIPALESKGMIGRRNILSPITIIRKYNKNEKEEYRWLKDLEKLLNKDTKKELGLTSNNLQAVNLICTQFKSLDEKKLRILIFDQFEEFFFTHASNQERHLLYVFLKECFSIPAIKIILSLKEDCLFYLLEMTRTVNLTAISNDILGKNFLYHLGNLSKEHTKSVIEVLTKRTEFPLEPELIEKLVEDLSSELGEVQPIELQLVGAQLEEEKLTSLSRYIQYGNSSRARVKTIIQHWLTKVIKDCGGESEEAAWKVLYQLTHQGKIRTIKTQNELMAVSSAKSKKMRTKQVEFILEVLEGSGLVLKLREDSKNYYQLTHDYLISYIDEEYNRQFDEVGKKIRRLHNEVNKDDLFVKLNAVIKLGEIDRVEVIKPLKNLLEKSNNQVGLRWYIFKALSQIQDEEAVELILKKGLNDPEPAIQAHAAHLLGQLKFKRAKDELIDKCQDRHRCVRVQSRWALMQLGEEPPVSQEYSNPLLAYILIKGAPTQVDNDDQSRIARLRKDFKLRETWGIVECGIVIGNYDFIIKVLAENLESLNELVLGMLPHLNWVHLTRTFVVVSEPRLYYWCRRSDAEYISYVVIETQSLDSNSLVTCLMDIREVSEAATIYGGFDVVAKIKVNDLKHRDEVLTLIGKIPCVRMTSTYPVMIEPRNSYWDNSAEFKLPEEWFID